MKAVINPAMAEAFLVETYEILFGVVTSAEGDNLASYWHVVVRVRLALGVALWLFALG